jgi:hypothetical protein
MEKRIGRPRKKPPGNAVELIRDLAADGFSVRGVAARLGTSQDTLRLWFERHPELHEAFEQGREVERYALHNALYRAATEQGNITASIFLLKSRHGYREGDQSDTANRVTINFTLPGALRMDEFKVIEHDSDRTKQLPTPRTELSRRS